MPAATPAEVEHVALVDVEHVRLDGDAREVAGEPLRVAPVRRRAAAVEQPGGGEHERARADRGDPGAAVGRRAQRVEHGRAAAARRASPMPGTITVSARASASSPCGATTSKPVSRRHRAGRRRAQRPRVALRLAPEHLGRDGEVEGDDLAADQDRRRGAWQESIERWRSCHWRATRATRDAPAMHAEILLFDGFDELDALGPWEVFAGLAAVRDDVTARFVTLEGEREVRADHGARRPRARRALRPPRPAARPRRRLVRPHAGRRLGAGPARRDPRARSPRATPRAASSRRSAPARCCSPPPASSTAAARRRTRRRSTTSARAARSTWSRRASSTTATSSPPARPPAGSTSRCTCSSGIGGPGARRRRRARAPVRAPGLVRPGLQPVGERA